MRGWLLLGLTGCASFASVDEACVDSVRGEPVADDLASALRRVDCHRRFLRLRPLTVTDGLLSSSAGHAAWLAANDPTDGGRLASWGAWLLQEDPEDTAFTGLNARDRVAAAGVALSDGHA